MDSFYLETSFEDFVRETQHKLLNSPVVQCEEEQVVEGTYDLSSFMAINKNVHASNNWQMEFLKIV